MPENKLMVPWVGVYSPLKRSMETALIASEYILAKTKPKLPLQLMSMLGGLDYGPSSTGEDYSEA